MFSKIKDFFSIHIKSTNLIQLEIIENESIEIQIVIQYYKNELIKEISQIDEKYRIYINSLFNQSQQKEFENKIYELYHKEADYTSRKNFEISKQFFQNLYNFNYFTQLAWEKVFSILYKLKANIRVREKIFDIERKYLNKLLELLKDTPSIINYLKVYLSTIEEVKNSEGNFEVLVNYAPTRKYLISEAVEKVFSIVIENKSKTKYKIPKQKTSEINKDVAIYKNVYKKDQQYSQISLKYRGSREWNLKIQNSFILGIEEWYNNISELSTNAYYINLDPKNIRREHKHIDLAMKARGIEEKTLLEYTKLIHTKMDSIFKQLTEEDFFDIPENEVFFYNCGPNLFFNYLIEDFYKTNLGIVFYINENEKRYKSLPMAYIKSDFINWWENFFAQLPIQKIDSYIIYTQQYFYLDTLARKLYNEALKKKNEKPPAKASTTLEDWIWKNRKKYFGTLRAQVFDIFNINVANPNSFCTQNRELIKKIIS